MHNFSQNLAVLRPPVHTAVMRRRVMRGGGVDSVAYGLWVRVRFRA